MVVITPRRAPDRGRPGNPRPAVNDAGHTQGGESGQAHPTGRHTGRWPAHLAKEITKQLNADREATARERDAAYKGAERRGGRKGGSSDSGGSGPYR